MEHPTHGLNRDLHYVDNHNSEVTTEQAQEEGSAQERNRRNDLEVLTKVEQQSTTPAPTAPTAAVTRRSYFEDDNESDAPMITTTSSSSSYSTVEALSCCIPRSGSDDTGNNGNATTHDNNGNVNVDHPSVPDVDTGEEAPQVPKQPPQRRQQPSTTPSSSTAQTTASSKDVGNGLADSNAKVVAGSSSSANSSAKTTSVHLDHAPSIVSQHGILPQPVGTIPLSSNSTDDSSSPANTGQQRRQHHTKSTSDQHGFGVHRAAESQYFVFTSDFFEDKETEAVHPSGSVTSPPSSAPGIADDSTSHSDEFSNVYYKLDHPDLGSFLVACETITWSKILRDCLVKENIVLCPPVHVCNTKHFRYEYTDAHYSGYLVWAHTPFGFAPQLEWKPLHRNRDDPPTRGRKDGGGRYVKTRKILPSNALLYIMPSYGDKDDLRCIISRIPDRYFTFYSGRLVSIRPLGESETTPTLDDNAPPGSTVDIDDDGFATATLQVSGNEDESGENNRAKDQSNAVRSPDDHDADEAAVKEEEYIDMPDAFTSNLLGLEHAGTVYEAGDSVDADVDAASAHQDGRDEDTGQQLEHCEQEKEEIIDYLEGKILELQEALRKKEHELAIEKRRREDAEVKPSIT